MIIRYCPKCPGKPYTKEWKITHCPIDGTRLEPESVDPSMLDGRPCFDNQEKDDSDPDDTDRTNEFDAYTDIYEKKNAPLDRMPHMSIAKKEAGIFDWLKKSVNGLLTRWEKKSDKPSTGNISVLTGRVTNYERSSISDTGYKRTIFSKIWQAMIYGQRTTDVLHSFTLRNDRNSTPGDFNSSGTVVNVHGIISTGASINENDVVEVIGSFSPRIGVFFARQINVNTGGRNVRVRFQHDISSVFKVLVGIVVIVCAILLCQFLSNHRSDVMTILVVACCIGLLVWLLNSRLATPLLFGCCSGKLLLPLLIVVMAVILVIDNTLVVPILCLASAIFGICYMFKAPK